METNARFNTGLIGTFAYPVDNSYTFNILTGKSKSLAGNAYDDKPCRVLIISEPYKKVIKSFGREYEHELVTVMYEGEVYTCFNQFHASEEEAMDHHDDCVQDYLTRF